MITAILTLLGIIGTIVAFIIKRKSAPTIQERKQDVEKQFTDTLANVSRLRAQGNNAEADAMLRRLNLVNSVFMRDEPARTVSDPDSER